MIVVMIGKRERLCCWMVGWPQPMLAGAVIISMRKAGEHGRRLRFLAASDQAHA
jgi:hypothetical protein